MKNCYLHEDEKWGITKLLTTDVITKMIHSCYKIRRVKKYFTVTFHSYKITFITLKSNEYHGSFVSFWILLQWYEIIGIPRNKYILHSLCIFNTVTSHVYLHSWYVISDISVVGVANYLYIGLKTFTVFQFLRYNTCFATLKKYFQLTNFLNKLSTFKIKRFINDI